MSEIHILGPLSIEVNLKVKFGACLAGDSHPASYKGIMFGGPLIKIARLIRTLGHSPTLWSYLGNDEFGNKIIEDIKAEQIQANIQKIPNMPTSIICKLSDEKDYSSYTTTIQDLSLWEFRIKNLKDTGVIFLDPAIPTSIQLEIIKKIKKATVVLKWPLDGSLDILSASKNLIILLNEHELFQIFRETEYKHFDLNQMLEHKIFKNHKILMESKYDISTLDHHGRIKQISLQTKRSRHFLTNEYYITGILTALASNYDYMEAFKWGMITSLQYEKNVLLDKIDILAQLKNFPWLPHDKPENEN